MTEKIAISTIAVVFISFALCPSPDPFSALTLGGMGAFLCAVPLLILARFAFVKSASKSIHALVCVLVCLVAILSVASYTLIMRVNSQQRWINDRVKVLNQTSHVALTCQPTSGYHHHHDGKTIL